MRVKDEHRLDKALLALREASISLIVLETRARTLQKELNALLVEKRKADEAKDHCHGIYNKEVERIASGRVEEFEARRKAAKKAAETRATKKTRTRGITLR